MGPIQKIENTLDDVLRKKAPYQLPENGRRGIANALWWLALILGVLQLWSAYGFWRAARFVDALADWTNKAYSAYGPASIPYVAHLGPFFYLSLLVLAASGVLLLLAVPKLKEHQKGGWDLLFYGALLNAAYGVVRIFSEYGGGIGGFIWAVVGTVIGAYFLFQVREYFTGAKSVTDKVAAPKAAAPTEAKVEETPTKEKE